jgi:acetyl-CoA carboxylase carboxyltransferase component
MEGRTLAIAAFNTKLDENFEIMSQDPEERAKIAKDMAAVEERIEKDMDPYVAARQMDTDEIVQIGELREWLKSLVEMSYQGAGYRRVKNPRIWSMHDLDIMSRGQS